MISSSSSIGVHHLAAGRLAVHLHDGVPGNDPVLACVCMYIYIYIIIQLCVCIYIYIERERDTYIYIYIYISICFRLEIPLRGLAFQMKLNPWTNKICCFQVLCICHRIEFLVNSTSPQGDLKKETYRCVYIYIYIYTHTQM